MQKKPRTRTDVQWVISSVSLAVTLGIWGLLAAHDKKGAAVAAQADIAQPQPTEQVIIPQPQMLVPGQVLLFGGIAPQPQQPVVIIKRARGGGAGGGGGGAGGGGGGAAAPAASTGSSRP